MNISIHSVARPRQTHEYECYNPEEFQSTRSQDRDVTIMCFGHSANNFNPLGRKTETWPAPQYV